LAPLPSDVWSENSLVPAVAHLPAVRGPGVDALDALRYGELLSVEDDDVSELHVDVGI
jgi:hypothetical protein